MVRTISRRNFLALSLLPIVAPSQFKTRSDLNAAIAALEEQLPKMMEGFKVPGLSIAVIRDARVRWRRGFGIADVVSRKLVDNDTVFQAASMSKPVFAYAVMKLCEKGLLNLDTPLTKYTLERFLEGDPRLDLITARHVLSHTTGFQNWRSEKNPLKIHFTPGEQYQYSGEGYNYLQTVVRRITNESFDPFMRTHLLGPFEMALSGYLWNDRTEKHLAGAHDPEGKLMPGRNQRPTDADVARYGSAGAMLTTPTDYAKFLIEVINPKPADDYRLNAASVAEMLRPQVKVSDEYSVSWTLGWKRLTIPAGEVITHGGDNPGFHCVALASPEKRSGFVLMTNSDGGMQLVNKFLTADLSLRLL